MARNAQSGTVIRTEWFWSTDRIRQTLRSLGYPVVTIRRPTGLYADAIMRDGSSLRLMDGQRLKPYTPTQGG